MRMTVRLQRCSVALATTALSVSACFIDSGEIPDDDDQVTSATTGTSSDGGTPPGDSTTMPAMTSVATGADTSSGGDTAETTRGIDSSGDSTGPTAPPCSCVPGAVLCEDFEDELDQEVWTLNSEPAGNNPVITSDVVTCGGGALQSTAAPTELFSLAQANLDGRALSGGSLARVGVQVHLSPGCLEASPPPWTRVAGLLIYRPTGSVWYEASVWLGAGIGELRLTNPAGGTVGIELQSDAFDDGEWFDLELALELSKSPAADVYVNGASVGGGSGGMAPPVDEISNAVVNLGPYQITPFEANCEIHYDDLWVAWD